jgi:hypothetical protein
MLVKTVCTFLGVALGLAPIAQAQTRDSTTTIRLNGFVDAYYAYDFARPFDGERRYTTQAVRHDEFNVNLAWLGVTLERSRTHARLALQAGTSVQANYSGEPRVGATSGPDVARFLQEAFVGVKLGKNVWLDGGIYYSYIGLEGWTSADNPTYTRSQVADYSPYYLSGVRLTWQAAPQLSAQLHVNNGWQKISENNRSKAVGVRLDYTVSPVFTVSYANFIGNERPFGEASHRRVFHQVMAKGTLPRSTQWQSQFDVGQQDGQSWYGVVAIVRHPITSRVAVNGRLERYDDPQQIIVTTLTASGFVANGVSAGVDVRLDGGVTWRSEWRTIRGERAVFPERAVFQYGRTNAMLVTSLSASF